LRSAALAPPGSPPGPNAHQPGTEEPKRPRNRSRVRIRLVEDAAIDLPIQLISPKIKVIIKD